MTSFKAPDIKKPNPPPTGVVFKPVSTENPMGFGDTAKQFIKTGVVPDPESTNIDGTYEKDIDGCYQLVSLPPLATSGPTIFLDDDQQIYVRRDLDFEATTDKELMGGNVYWRRKSDGMTMSWHGPISGAVLPPRPIRNLFGNIDHIVEGHEFAFQGQMVVITGGVTRTYNIFTYDSSFPALYVHGKKMNPNPPSKVRAAAMIGDTMVLVGTSNIPTIDPIYYQKLSELQEFGWQLAGVVDWASIVPAGKEMLLRSSVYSFDQTGLKIVGIVDFIDRTLNGINFVPQLGLSRMVVDIDLAIDAEGIVVTIDSSDNGTENILAGTIDRTRNSTLTVDIDGSDPDDGCLSINTSNETGVITAEDVLLAVGYGGLDGNEKIILQHVFDPTKSFYNSNTVGELGFLNNSVDRDLNQVFAYKLFAGNDELTESNRTGGLSSIHMSANGFTASGTDITTFVSEIFKLLFVNIQEGIYLFESSKSIAVNNRQAPGNPGSVADYDVLLEIIEYRVGVDVNDPSLQMEIIKEILLVDSTLPSAESEAVQITSASQTCPAGIPINSNNPDMDTIFFDPTSAVFDYTHEVTAFIVTTPLFELVGTYKWFVEEVNNNLFPITMDEGQENLLPDPDNIVVAELLGIGDTDVFLTGQDDFTQPTDDPDTTTSILFVL